MDNRTELDAHPSAGRGPFTATASAHAANRGTAGSISGLKATLPIPADTKYTGISSPAGALASTDGINFAATPLKKTVNGKVVEVPLKDYRALQWQVAALPSKKAVTVTAQTKVNAAND